MLPSALRSTSSSVSRDADEDSELTDGARYWYACASIGFGGAGDDVPRAYASDI